MHPFSANVKLLFLSHFLDLDGKTLQVFIVRNVLIDTITDNLLTLKPILFDPLCILGFDGFGLLFLIETQISYLNIEVI